MEPGARYDWDEHNEGHVAAHGELGHTNASRILFVAWTPRGKLKRPVTDFDANRKTRAAYQRRRNEEKR
jgi:hypothetical protein